MARDGLFFKSVGWLSREDRSAGRCHCAAGRDRDRDRALGTLRTDPQLCGLGGFYFFWHHCGLAICVSAERYTTASAGLYLTPGHPYTTGLFVLACVAIVTVPSQASPQISRSACLSCSPASRYIGTGAANCEARHLNRSRCIQNHETATLRLHAMGEDPGPREIQPRDQRRWLVSLARTSNPSISSRSTATALRIRAAAACDCRKCAWTRIP